MGLSYSAMLLYRIAHWSYRKRIPILPTLIYTLNYFVYRCSIPPSVQIGAGSKLSYGGFGIFINKNCKLGARCFVGTDVVITGTFGSGVPVIGSNVWIATGSRILGDVEVGNNVIIGANSVLLRSVPDNCIVAGNPARVVGPLRGAFDAPTAKWDRPVPGRKQAEGTAPPVAMS